MFWKLSLADSQQQSLSTIHVYDSAPGVITADTKLQVDRKPNWRVVTTPVVMQ